MKKNKQTKAKQNKTPPPKKKHNKKQNSQLFEWNVIGETLGCKSIEIFIVTRPNAVGLIFCFVNRKYISIFDDVEDIKRNMTVRFHKIWKKRRFDKCKLCWNKNPQWQADNFEKKNSLFLFTSIVVNTTLVTVFINIYILIRKTNEWSIHYGLNS